jgi:hypothetical protein
MCGGGAVRLAPSRHRIRMGRAEPLQKTLLVPLAQSQPRPPRPFQPAHPASPACRGNDNPRNQNPFYTGSKTRAGRRIAVPAMLHSPQSTLWRGNTSLLHHPASHPSGGHWWGNQWRGAGHRGRKGERGLHRAAHRASWGHDRGGDRPSAPVGHREGQGDVEGQRSRRGAASGMTSASRGRASTAKARGPSPAWPIYRQRRSP